MNSEKIVEVTDKALVKIREIFENDEGFVENKSGLRLGVIGGGCSGLSYKIEMDMKKDKDNTLIFNDVMIYIDPKSAIYLKGVTLDFADGLEGKGFIFVNPNASNTCGCGESFSI